MYSCPKSPNDIPLKSCYILDMICSWIHHMGVSANGGAPKSSILLGGFPWNEPSSYRIDGNTLVDRWMLDHFELVSTVHFTTDSNRLKYFLCLANVDPDSDFSLLPGRTSARLLPSSLRKDGSGRVTALCRWRSRAHGEWRTTGPQALVPTEPKGRGRKKLAQEPVKTAHLNQ